jgi:hypothetical protein
MESKVIALAVSFGLFCSQSAHAGSICWNNHSIAAAKLVDLEVMLDMASNRCIAEMPVLKNQYLRFNKLNAPHFAEANRILNEQFQKSGSETDVKLTHDSFILLVKQNYGTDASGLQCSEFSKLVGSQKSEALTKENIIQLSDIAGALPTVVGKRCANRMSVAKIAATDRTAATH